MVEKILFLDQIFEMEILMDLHILRSFKPENNIFSDYLTLSMEIGQINLCTGAHKKILTRWSLWAEFLVSVH